LRLLLDNGVPRGAVPILVDATVDAVHVGAIGLADASDAQIIAHAMLQQMIVVTLDADFHTLLAISGADKPSVIRIRVEGLRAAACAELIMKVIRRFATELVEGAALSVDAKSVRCHSLPMGSQ
jgi:predicted nuclease of predicted toxin-antitoxin system